MPELIVSDLSKSYPTPAEPLVILDGVNMNLSGGESLAVVGPSGSGKSTLLAILGVLDAPSSGSVQLDGRDPFVLERDAQARFRADQIGFVFQDHHLLPQCTVLENVMVPFLATGVAGEAEQAKARDLLDRVGLSARLTHRPAELSGGERQRVAIARALVRDPLLVLADEPTGNLDESTAQQVASMLIALQQSLGSILVTVTHSMELAAAMGSVRRLQAGQLIES